MPSWIRLFTGVKRRITTSAERIAMRLDVGLVVAQRARVVEPDDEQADPHDRRRRQDVDERPPEDQLHVHQPVLAPPRRRGRAG